MTLCDIGNTSYHFLKGDLEYKKEVASFDPASIDEDVYYISVNAVVDTKLSDLSHWHDLRSSIHWSDYYETMGVDRIMACEAIKEGLVIDAGSAITVDLVTEGRLRVVLSTLDLRRCKKPIVISPQGSIIVSILSLIWIKCQKIPEMLSAMAYCVHFTVR